MKSNPLLGITARLHRAGCSAEVASGFEYRAARRAGVPGERIVFNGPLKLPDELRRALAEGATVVADGAEQVRDLARLAGAAAPGARVGLRLVPPDREGRDRFGVAPRAAPAAARMLARAGLPLTGLHVHLGAYQLGPLPPSGPPVHGVTVQYPVPVERFSLAARALRETAERVGGVAWLDLGGGWPAAAGLGEHLAAVREALGPGARSPDRRARPRPGARRRLAPGPGGGPARPRRGRRGCRRDPGAVRALEALPGPRGRAARRAGCAPPTCSARSACSTTRWPARSRSAPLRVGDLVWIGQAGAYAMAQASPFIHLRPGAVLVEGGRAAVLRARRDRRRGARRPGRAAPGGPRGPGRVRVIEARVRAGRWADSARLMAAAREAERIDGRRAGRLLHGHGGQPARRRAGSACGDAAMDGAGPDDLVLGGRGGRAPGPASTPRRAPWRAPPLRPSAGRRARAPFPEPRSRPTWPLISVPGEYAALEAHKALGARHGRDAVQRRRQRRGRGRPEAPRPPPGPAGHGAGLRHRDPGRDRPRLRQRRGRRSGRRGGRGRHRRSGGHGAARRPRDGREPLLRDGRARPERPTWARVTALDAIDRLARDPATEVVLCVSKPPDPEVAERVLEALAATGKPAVACFVGAVGRDAPDGRGAGRHPGGVGAPGRPARRAPAGGARAPPGGLGAARRRARALLGRDAVQRGGGHPGRAPGRGGLQRAGRPGSPPRRGRGPARSRRASTWARRSSPAGARTP